MRAALVVVAAALACSPSVGVDDADGDSGDSTGDEETSAGSTDDTNPTSVDPTDATTSTGTDATTTGTSVDTSTSEIDTGESTGPVEPLCSACNVFFQDCFMGQKCVPSNCDAAPIWIDVGCRDVVEAPVGVGEACTAVDSPYSGFDDCDEHSMCWNVDEATLAGTCAQLCEGSKGAATCTDADDVCFVGLDGILPVCVPRCDPLASSCAVDEECVHNVDNDTEPGFACTIDELVGAYEYGDDCTDGLLCETGLVCRGATHVPGCEGGRCCTTLGRLSDPPVCPDASQTCVPLYPAPPEGVDEDLCYCGVAP